MKISLKPDKPSDYLFKNNPNNTPQNIKKTQYSTQKPPLYYSFLWLLVFISFLEKANSQTLTPNPNTVPVTNPRAAVIIPIIAVQTTNNIPNSDFNPNIYFNANYTKIQPYLVPEATSLLADRACFQRLVPVIGYLSDFEQALLVRAALQNQDNTRCFDCDYYSNNLMNAIKKELANAVKFLNIESYTKRDPMRCMLNLISMGESTGNSQNQQQTIVAQTDNTDRANFLPGVTTQNMMDNQNVVLKSINSPNLQAAVQEPLSAEVAKEFSDYLYYQALGNQCAAEFLYEVQILLMDRRRYLCARNDDMINIANFDSNNKIIAFKWTYKEAEKMTDIFSKYAQCKSIENNIYPQVFNKANGILASNKPCAVEADMIINQTIITNPSIQVVPVNLVVENAARPIDATNQAAIVTPVVPANQAVTVNLANNPGRFLNEKLVYLGKDIFETF